MPVQRAEQFKTYGRALHRSAITTSTTRDVSEGTNQ